MRSPSLSCQTTRVCQADVGKAAKGWGLQIMVGCEYEVSHMGLESPVNPTRDTNLT